MTTTELRWRDFEEQARLQPEICDARAYTLYLRQRYDDPSEVGAGWYLDPSEELDPESPEEAEAIRRPQDAETLDYCRSREPGAMSFSEYKRRFLAGRMPWA